MHLVLTIFEAVVLASSVSIDAFTAGFVYGSNKIKIPFPSIMIINIVCSIFIGAGLLLGNLLQNHIPFWFTTGLAFTILFVLGSMKLLDSITKSIIRKHSDINKEIKISFLNFKFIINLYANPEKADVDSSKIISSGEATAVAISLALDGLAIGIGSSLAGICGITLFLLSFITDLLAITLGCFIGNKIARKSPFNLSWLGGMVLLILAFSTLL